MTDIRVLTYNIRALRDDAEAVSAVMRACAPDIVCVQEAPRFTRWRSKRAAIARKAGLVVATADRPAGLMILVSMRVQVVSTSFRLLPKSESLHQRAVCSALLRVGGVELTAASVHLSLDADERQRHLPELWAALPSRRDALVVGADANEEPGGPVWTELSTTLRDAWAVAGSGAGHTYSAASPHKRIDGVFVGEGFDIGECRAVDDLPEVARASDHLPVLAVLRPALDNSSIASTL
ncbi:MAG: endonuclease/exonuclease/phosphatase family protein [Frankiaceae bacterium]|nr:endonuclease/exonuclease/phosphatase family protein [Frankiaceae bacterium]MBV9369448.1 endonuclease/exonuclease/phosphatase family protein [Frankiales bacterium]